MFNENYAKYYDLLNKRKDYKKEVEFVYKWAKKPGFILDIGCGTAKYWKYFPKGTHIRGIEASHAMIEKAENRLQKLIYLGRAETLKWVELSEYDCVTAFFDVVNYIEDHSWWKYMPLKKGGYWIFDIWDKQKVIKEGFRVTTVREGKVKRTIAPAFYNHNRVELDIETNGYIETHKMYLHSFSDIEKFCGKEFEIVDVKTGPRWQSWYKCRKK